MVIPLAAPASLKENLFFSVRGDLEKEIIGFSIPGHGAQWHLKYYICTICTSLQAASTISTIPRFDMFLVFEVDEGP